MKIPSEITFETTETNWVCMIVFLCAHVRISISTYILTSIVTYLSYMHPLCKILNTPVMSICLVKQNDGTWVEKTSTFFIQRLQTFFFIFITFFTFLTFFFIFSGTFFFTSMPLYTPHGFPSQTKPLHSQTTPDLRFRRFYKMTL